LIAEGPPGTVPDVRGLSAREAVRKLVTLGLSAHLAGDGIVVSQSPEAGSPLEPATTRRLVLQRPPPGPVPAEHPCPAPRCPAPLAAAVSSALTMGCVPLRPWVR